jgi:hypothetical protein
MIVLNRTFAVYWKLEGTVVQELFSNLEDAFPALFGGALGWIVLWIGASIVYRKSRGKPIYPRKPDHTLFFESYGSGNSNRNLLTKLGGASNCLSVAVTKDSLIVRPIFPFNLMFLPEIYGLEYEIPRRNIRSVVEKKGFLGKITTLEFSTSDGEQHSIDLRLRGMDQFLQALGTK